MSRVLRIADVCRELGRSTDCIRDWVRRGILPATRSPSGQLQFDPRHIQAIGRGEMAPVTERPAPPRTTATTSPTADTDPRPPRRPAWEEMSPWDQEVGQARASVDVERSVTALEEIRAERERAQQATDRLRAEQAAEAAEHERLTRLKQRAKLLAWVPKEIEAQVTAAIERFVSSAQVPAWLSPSAQSQLVFDHVTELVQAWRTQQAEKMAAQIRQTVEHALRTREVSRKHAQEDKPERKQRSTPTEDLRTVARARRRQEREGRLDS